MRIVALILLCFSSYVIAEKTETTKWDKQCGEKGCVFFYDVFHKSMGKTEVISLAVAVTRKPQKIAFFSIHYPPQAKNSKNTFFAFANSHMTKDGYSIMPLKSTLVSAAFERCDQESCITRLFTHDFKQYDLEHALRNHSHLWFAYTNKGKSIRALASLRPLQSEIDRM